MHVTIAAGDFATNAPNMLAGTHNCAQIPKLLSPGPNLTLVRFCSNRAFSDRQGPLFHTRRDSNPKQHFLPPPIRLALCWRPPRGCREQLRRQIEATWHYSGPRLDICPFPLAFSVRGVQHNVYLLMFRWQPTRKGPK
jgi:hypothetical protein